MKSKVVIIIYSITFLFFSITCFGQDSTVTKPGFKSSIEFYPSLNAMKGIGYYKIVTGYYKQPTLKYYNQTFDLGVFFNADWKIKTDISVQFYLGYTRWLQANLFPIGLMLKPKLNKKPNELYLKIGGGFTFGNRYDDQNEPWLASSMPKDYGSGSMHFQAGLEKNLHLSSNKSLSIGFLLNIQFIKSYFRESAQASISPTLSSYFIPYKFAGLTIAYHFY